MQTGGSTRRWLDTRCEVVVMIPPSLKTSSSPTFNGGHAMSREPAESHRRGVVCMFCSTRTKLPVSFSDQKESYFWGESNPG